MKERVLGILFLSLWMFQSFFPYLSYEWERRECWNHFEQIKNQLPDQEIETICFNLYAEISWEKEGKEFKLNGKLYDVISIHETDDLITLRCVEDSKEEGLQYAHQKPLKSPRKNSTKTKFKKIKYCAEKMALPTFSTARRFGITDNEQSAYSSRYPDIDSPPPEVA